MNLFEVLKQLPSTSLVHGHLPDYLYGAFRRKSISFYNGLTDEKTIVYWFQSKSFTIDLRLSSVTHTPVTQRQGWIGNTLWDGNTQLLSWDVQPYANYQNHVQWPEPARLHAIGNCLLEFSPSNVYVEDWRQQAHSGLFLGLRLQQCIDTDTKKILAMDGGLIICGQHIAYALSRLPEVQQHVAQIDLQSADTLNALDKTQHNAIDSFEVSISTQGDLKQFTTCDLQYQHAFNFEHFETLDDQHLIQHIRIDNRLLKLIYTVDVYLPDYTFSHQTITHNAAQAWFTREQEHLLHHAVAVL